MCQTHGLSTLETGCTFRIAPRSFEGFPKLSSLLSDPMQHFQELLQTSRRFGVPSDVLAFIPMFLHSFRHPCIPPDVLAFLLTF